MESVPEVYVRGLVLPLSCLLLAQALTSACAVERRRGGGGGGGPVGDPPGEGEGEGEEGEGEGPSEGEGEGPSEGEGEGPAEGEGEGPACEPHDEVCDGRDNDCDGRTDEDDPHLGEGCSTGLPGPCWQGRQRCQEGALVCVGVVQPQEEVCDGLDNDCNGEADEGAPESGQPCDAGEPGECARGATRCEDGVLRCIAPPPGEEACDGVDNDCNGQVDEGAPGHDEPCDTGELGVCAEGIGRCEDGVFECVRQQAPSDEECDRLDNDCDGETDEDDGQGECNVVDPDRFWRCEQLDGPWEVWKMEANPENEGVSCGDLCAAVGAPGCAGRTGNTPQRQSCNSGSGHEPAARNCNHPNGGNYWEWCYCQPR